MGRNKQKSGTKDQDIKDQDISEQNVIEKIDSSIDSGEEASGATVTSVAATLSAPDPSETGQSTPEPSAPEQSAAEPSTAAAQKATTFHLIGEIAWLLGQSPTHKHLAMTDLDWLVMPAIMNGQCRIFRTESRPMGVAFWAYLSDEAAERFGKGEGRVRPDEWRSGENLWLIDLVAPFATNENKQAELMLAELISGAFDGAPAMFRRRDPATGKMAVHRLAKKGESDEKVA